MAKVHEQFLQEYWVELIATFFLALGLLIALLMRTAFMAYMIIVLSGFLAGRISSVKKMKEPIFPFVIIILAFILGYTLASLKASRIVIIVLFFVSAVVSYYLHKNKIIGIFKSKDFIK